MRAVSPVRRKITRGRFRLGAVVSDVVCRPRWDLLLAGSVLLLLAIPGVGTAAAAVTIDTTNHTVTTSRFAIQFGNATTNIPNDPERIDSRKWTGTSGVQTPRFTLLGVASLTTARAAVRSLADHRRGPSASISVRAATQRRSPHEQSGAHAHR